MDIVGATNKVATLKEAVSAAEHNAAVERTEREVGLAKKQLEDKEGD